MINCRQQTDRRQEGGERAAPRRVQAAYLFVLPTFATLIALKYYPTLSAMYHSFFQWDGFTAPGLSASPTTVSWFKTK